MKKISIKRVALITSIFALLGLHLGCSTAKKEAVKKIQVGMDKADVLEIIGNPSSTGRAHGMDRWVLAYDTPSGMEKTYIYFDGGKVQYVGPDDAPKNKKFQAVPETSLDNKQKGSFKDLNN